MVTADDVCRVAIFAGLDPADCERLARAAADIALLEGEYAAHEGADRIFAHGSFAQAQNIPGGMPSCPAIERA